MCPLVDCAPGRPPRAILALAIAVLVAATAARGQLVSGDPATYVGLAQSLASGAGYYFNGAPHTSYPPGFPLALTPVVAIFGLNVTAAQVYVGLWAVLSLLTILAYLKKRREAISTAVTVFILLNGYLYLLATTSIRSEPVFMTVLFALLLSLEGGPSSSVGRPLWLVSLILLGAAIPATRAVGIAILPALVASALQAWTRDIRGGNPVTLKRVEGLCAAGLGALIFTVWWRLWISGASYESFMVLRNPHVPDEGLATIGDLAGRIIQNVRIQSAHLGELASNIGWLQPTWSSPAVLLLSPIVMVGCLDELRRPVSIAGWYTLSYVGIILLWPFDEGGRFLAPILPLFAVFAIRGAIIVRPRFWRMLAVAAVLGIGISAIEMRTGGAISRQQVAWLAAWVGSLLLCGTISLWRRVSATPFPNRGYRSLAVASFAGLYVALGVWSIGQRAWSNVAGLTLSPYEVTRGAISWIAGHTRASDRIMTQWWQGIHLHTGRLTIQMPVTGDPVKLCTALDALRPEYVLVTDPPGSSYFRPTEAERFAIIERLYPISFKLVHGYQGGRIYQFSPPTAHTDCQAVSQRSPGGERR